MLTTAALDIKMQHKHNKTRFISITLQSMQLICCLAIFIHFTQKRNAGKKTPGGLKKKKRVIQASTYRGNSHPKLWRATLCGKRFQQ